jgi:hypothetical protein
MPAVPVPIGLTVAHMVVLPTTLLLEVAAECAKGLALSCGEYARVSTQPYVVRALAYTPDRFVSVVLSHGTDVCLMVILLSL